VRLCSDACVLGGRRHGPERLRFSAEIVTTVVTFGDPWSRWSSMTCRWPSSWKFQE
jgi:hypothetical protein